jgi:hypothetical protein
LEPEDPGAECCYDEKGDLVTESRPFSGCRGTNDDYKCTNPINCMEHTFRDRGGIRYKGDEGKEESQKHRFFYKERYYQ